MSRVVIEMFGVINVVIFMMAQHSLNAIPRHYTHDGTIIGARHWQQMSDRVKFPDDDSEPRKEPFDPMEKPACPQGITVCEDVDGYPYELVEKVLNKSGEFAKFFADDIHVMEDTEMSGRQLEDSSLSLCNSQKKILFPKWGVTTKNEYKFIANQNDSTQYVQAVKVEVCTGEKAPCALYTELPKGYSTRCKQKFVERKLVTVSKNGEELGVDKFLIPTSCCCTYKKALF